MRVVCVYKSGGDYDLRHVKAFVWAAQEYFSDGTEIMCLTDEFESVEIPGILVMPLKHVWSGWWSKLELFRPDLTYYGTTIYFDLDVMILKDISRLTSLCSEAVHPIMLRSCDQVGKTNDWPSSSIMSWKGGSMNHIYTEFAKNPLANIAKTQANTGRAGQRTDQGFMREFISPTMFQDILPLNYVVFKAELMKNNKLWQDLHILNWTGNPRVQTCSHPFRNEWQKRVRLFNQINLIENE